MNKMHNNINILILAAGIEKNRKEDGYPLCLSEINSEPLLQKIISQTNKIKNCKLIINFREEDINKYHLDNIARLLNPDTKIFKIPGETQGAACTALFSISEINNDDNLLIINANEYINIDYANTILNFNSQKLDAGVVVFKSIHPRYSYVKLDNNSFVVEASEKNPISNNATTGFYWFSKGSDFVNAAMSTIKKDARVNDLFYICPTFNEMILDNKRIGIFKIDEKLYYPIKSERQLENFENSNL